MRKEILTAKERFDRISAIADQEATDITRERTEQLASQIRGLSTSDGVYPFFQDAEAVGFVDDNGVLCMYITIRLLFGWYIGEWERVVYGPKLAHIPPGITSDEYVLDTVRRMASESLDEFCDDFYRSHVFLGRFWRKTYYPDGSNAELWVGQKQLPELYNVFQHKLLPDLHDDMTRLTSDLFAQRAAGAPTDFLPAQVDDVVIETDISRDCRLSVTTQLAMKYGGKQYITGHITRAEDLKWAYMQGDDVFMDAIVQVTQGIVTDYIRVAAAHAMACIAPESNQVLRMMRELLVAAWRPAEAIQWSCPGIGPSRPMQLGYNSGKYVYYYGNPVAPLRAIDAWPMYQEFYTLDRKLPNNIYDFLTFVELARAEYGHEAHQEIVFNFNANMHQIESIKLDVMTVSLQEILDKYRLLGTSARKVLEAIIAQSDGKTTVQKQVEALQELGLNPAEYQLLKYLSEVRCSWLYDAARHIQTSPAVTYDAVQRYLDRLCDAKVPYGETDYSLLTKTLVDGPGGQYYQYRLSNFLMAQALDGVTPRPYDSRDWDDIKKSERNHLLAQK